MKTVTFCYQSVWKLGLDSLRRRKKICWSYVNSIKRKCIFVQDPNYHQKSRFFDSRYGMCLFINTFLRSNIRFWSKNISLLHFRAGKKNWAKIVYQINVINFFPKRYNCVVPYKSLSPACRLCLDLTEKLFSCWKSKQFTAFLIDLDNPKTAQKNLGKALRLSLCDKDLKKKGLQGTTQL
jgi:hypothetical protein